MGFGGGGDVGEGVMWGKGSGCGGRGVVPSLL